MYSAKRTPLKLYKLSTQIYMANNENGRHSVRPRYLVTGASIAVKKRTDRETDVISFRLGLLGRCNHPSVLSLCGE